MFLHSLFLFLRLVLNTSFILQVW